MPKYCKRKTTTSSTCSWILRNRLQTSTIDDSLRQIVSSDDIAIQNERLEDESEDKYNWESRSLDTNLYFITAINLHLSEITNPLYREFILTLLLRILM